MSKHKFLKFILILLGIVAVYFYLFRDEFKEYNLKKSISACIMANKKISKSSKAKNPRNSVNRWKEIPEEDKSLLD